jgi:hypothetical protein
MQALLFYYFINGFLIGQHLPEMISDAHKLFVRGIGHLPEVSGIHLGVSAE